MEDTVYTEWVSAGLLWKALLTLVSLIILCLLIITVAVGGAVQKALWGVFSVSVLVFLVSLLFLLNYRGIRIQVTHNRVIITYGLFNRKHIPLSDIVSCEPTKASLRKYLGIGIRYGTDRSWAYTTSFGDAVKITLQRERPFVFSSNNPEQVCNAINQTRSKL